MTRASISSEIRKASGIKRLGGRSSSSKTLGIVSDMHVGSTTALYSGYGPSKITPDQQKLRDWWTHCSDVIGKCDLLLINGEPVEGTHYKSNAYELWSGDLNEQLADSERLIRQWKYDKLLLTRGSKYHSQDGQTSYEELLARKMNNVVQYHGLFGQALNLLNKQKQIMAYNGDYSDYYCFFKIHDKVFNATHEIGFSRQKASRSGALGRELVSMELERYYHNNVDCLIRSHNHYYVHLEFSNIIGIVTPAWKLADSHLYHGGMAIVPDIGAVSVTIEPNSDLHVQKYIMPRERLPKPKLVRI